MAASFIGKRISLISQSDVRYLGTLAGIDPVASTIQLSHVFSLGTESRRPASQFIPPVAEPYTYIIFRASEVKDLAVDEPATQPSVHDDPAVVGASAPLVGAGPTYAQQVSQSLQQSQQQQQIPNLNQQLPGQTPVPHQGQRGGGGGGQNQNPRHTANQARRTNSINSATASLEVVERALGDLRVGGPAPNGTVNNNHRSGKGSRRNGAVSNNNGPKPEVPTTDFDFESSNARFDKAALGKEKSPAGSGVGGGGAAGDSDEEGGEGKENQDSNGKAKETPAYDPKSSFFDSLTPGPVPPSSGPGGGRGGGGGRGRGRGGRGGGSSLARSRREEERQRNVATFGEPGGVGLLGPGAYVGGWGGYGRGGGRGRPRNVGTVA